MFLSFVMWVGMGHRAAKHIAVDSYPDSKPSMGHGWGFDLIVTSFVFVLIASVSSHFAVKMSLDDTIGLTSEQMERSFSTASTGSTGIADYDHVPSDRDHIAASTAASAKGFVPVTQAQREPSSYQAHDEL